MLPKNRLADALINNLYVYEGAEHEHQAQQPKVIDLNTIK
jgi:large subunit ribosomal protein L13